ncbi:MAG: hypothetical protein ACI4JN_09240 [Ruminococcus sp.]
MKIKKITALIIGIIAVGSVFTACSSDKDSRTDPVAEPVLETSLETSGETSESSGDEEQTIEIEETAAAKSGDAYLAVADGQWYVQYWGTDADLLAYDAGIASITDNGEYTVSVNGASKGMIYDITGKADGEYTPSGCSFMAVIVKDGSILYPNMSIEITGIRIDGKEIEMTAQSYTCSDDDVEMRANIYNEWVKNLPEDAHNSEGEVTDADLYSPRIIDIDKIGEWTSIEVDFTVSGIGEETEDTDSEEYEEE